jgi:hypothetical protein
MSQCKPKPDATEECNPNVETAAKNVGGTFIMYAGAKLRERRKEESTTKHIYPFMGLVIKKVNMQNRKEPLMKLRKLAAHLSHMWNCEM